MSRLILKPTVHVVASTVIHVESLDLWRQANGLEESHEALDKLEQAVQRADTDRFDGDPDSISLDRVAEFAGRHCYRAWDKGRPNDEYLRNIVESGHGSVLHHGTMSFAISGISRSLSLELLRHRVGCDPSQESQRYVDAKDMMFVVPPLIIRMAEERGDDSIYTMFERECRTDIDSYEFWINKLKKHFGEANTTIDKKRFLEAARSRLPNAAETRLVLTCNMRALRWICSQRGASFADLEIRRLAVEMVTAGMKFAPNTFYDYKVTMGDDGFPVVNAGPTTAKV